MEEQIHFTVKRMPNITIEELFGIIEKIRKKYPNANICVEV